MECVNRVASHVPCKRRNMLRMGRLCFRRNARERGNATGISMRSGAVSEETSWAEFAGDFGEGCPVEED